MRGLWKACFALGIAIGLVAPAAWADHHEGGKGHAEGGRGKMQERHFEKRDADGNGEISKDEWMGASEERFAKIDTDGNDAISQEESTAHHEAMRKRWKEQHGGGH